MDSKENQPDSTAGRSGAISYAIDQGKEVEVLWLCAIRNKRNLWRRIYSKVQYAWDTEKTQTKDIMER